MKKVSTIILGLAIVLFFGVSVDYAGGPNKITVGVDGDYQTIQDAVDAVAFEATILVEAGIYPECVVINGKDISLMADGHVIVRPGVSCPNHKDVIQVYNANVSIVGFEIDATNCMGGLYVKGGLDGLGSASLSALDNNVHSYLKNGITANGPDAYGQFVDNFVQGIGPQGVPYLAQNGIQFGWQATGVAMRNTVEANFYTGPDWGATGILIFQADGVMVQKNTVRDCGTGIAIETWCWYGSDDVTATASLNRIMKNTIEGCEYGVSVIARDFWSTCSASADNNKVDNNTIMSIGGSIGIFIGSFPAGNFTPSAYNNKVIHNIIDGFDVAIDEGGTATKTKVQANEL